MLKDIPIADIVGIATSIGIIGTLIFGFINLNSTKKNEERTRKYAEYEKRKEKFLLLCADYFAKYEMRKVMVKPKKFNEIGEQNEIVQEYVHEFGSICYQVILHLRESNPHSNEINNLILESLKLFEEIHSEWSNSVFAFLARQDGIIPQEAKEINGEFVDLNKIADEMMKKGEESILRQHKEFERIRNEILTKIKVYLAFEDNLVFGEEE